METAFRSVYKGQDLSTHQADKLSSFYLEAINELEKVRQSPSHPVRAKVRPKKGNTIDEKKQRKWTDSYTKNDLKTLDICPQEKVWHAVVPGPKMPVQTREEEEENSSGTLEKKFHQFVLSVVGKREITESDLSSIKEKLRQHMVTQNVAVTISETIINNAFTQILGRNTGVLGISPSLIQKELTKALSHVFRTDKTDLFNEISRAKARNKQYVMAIMGVNGVGKSTTVSKLCFSILNHGHSVAIVGADTFRSGAIEQLDTHVKRLRGLFADDRIMLFQKGYGKDPVHVVRDAIQQSRGKFDVVLVDTAGRMQGNRPLMRSLALLVQECAPDKTIFVGEALVGNEALDQLEKFQEALTSYSSGKERTIDCVIVTKMDTVGEMVGSIVNMAYSSNAPILFIGTGQQYTDLHPLNPRKIIEQLLDKCPA